MKAQNKFQKEIMQFKLRPITPNQKAWAIEKTLPKYFVICRKTVFCLECGHKWKENILWLSLEKKCTCPHCKAKLELCSNHSINRTSDYFAILTTHKGYQVVRMFIGNKYLKKRNACHNHIKEVMQHWIRPNGETETLALATQGMSMYYDAWVYHSQLEPRSRSYKHEMRCKLAPEKIYPRRKVLPLIKRNGFRGYTYFMAPHRLFKLLLTDSRAETLFKAGQIELIRNYFNDGGKIRKYWSTIRICLRNSYVIKNFSLYFDYLELLDYFGKDLNNATYVCPDNLKQEHDRYARKKNEITDHEKNLLFQSRYEQEKAKFFDLLFRDKDLVVEPLKSVEEFQQEGKALGHCVYSNEYYKKPNSLVFSAKIDGKHTETVQFSLSELKILQSRGRGNNTTEHNQRIKQLVRDNVHQITKALSA